MPGFAEFVGIACFSFGLQTILLSVRDGMQQPSRAPSAVAYALVAVVSFYSVVGLVFSELFEKAPNGVEQMIIQNLPVDQPIATLVIACSAAVAALSMPLPMFPLVELLYMYAIYLLPSTQSLSGGRSAALAAQRTVILRLLILLVTSSTACFFQGFASVAGFLGCLTIISSQLLPPLIHLRLCSWPAMSSAQHSKDRSFLVYWRLSVDIGFALLGGASFVYFTWLTGRQLALGTGS
ncbi:hypothetical protein AB1Y20_011954 [Prymnesium parvum]|uniref:Amino acid transporter transmembrane domain-containing protein n=1 Tax=Prymnesium parvum TaxID=97485 RepID=A0AB34IQN6_PRYPA